MNASQGRKRYFTSGSGAMVTGWLTNSKGQRRYFDPSTGYMKTKWLKLGNKTYYLYSKSGIAATGFVKDSKEIPVILLRQESWLQDGLPVLPGETIFPG